MTDEAHRDTALAPTSMTESSDGAAAATTEPGTPAQRYRLGATLGRGGMGEVLSARDEQIGGRAVAIKRMRDAEPDAKTVARFMREAVIQGRLDHPAIVPVHELSRDAEGRPFFAMKQLAGITLADVIGMTLVEDRDTAAKFPRQRQLAAFADVCLAIELAHARKIVHRDLKPANIMLGDYGEVYVIDWGIARVLDDDTTIPEAVGAMVGTPGYMSPEQIRGDADVDGRADVYALGCILFEILACEPLFKRGKAGLEEALEDAIDRKPSARAPTREIPPELDAAVVAATASDRDERIQSARELGTLVQRYLDGDRDLALRQELARRELAAAKDILEGGLLATMSHSRQEQRRPRRDEITAYAAAMNAAARALALDPKSKEAAALVGRMMMEPPTEVPPEVDTKLLEVEDEWLRSAGRIGVRAVIGYFIFFPVIWLGGLREVWLLAGGTALTIGIMVSAYLVSEKPTTPRIYAALLFNVALVAVYSRGLSPFLVGPGTAVLTAMMFAAYPRVRPLAVWLGCAAGVLIPLALEVFGQLSATTTISGSSFVMTLPTDKLDPDVAIYGMAGYVLVILLIAIVFVRLQALEQRRSRRLIQMQAWKLEQLMPKTA
jgi:eukaryotic-like serine/threonine-protein kinase